jgi:hypothetical protein
MQNILLTALQRNFLASKMGGLTLVAVSQGMHMQAVHEQPGSAPGAMLAARALASP